ncbi:MAG: UDP-N-acetylmuramate--L-alanine ligase [Oscillospiraceae bacterium]
MTDVAAILNEAKRVHFVGIGGSGMFPLVEILHSEGYEITGSDVLEGGIISSERAMGIAVNIGHDASLVEGADAVVVTAALLAGNPETTRAKELGIPIIERAELLGYISSLYNRAICISGTHGKTTSTSMLVSIFMLAKRDPSAVIGGKLPLINGYGRKGSGDCIVIEACEFKDTFLHLVPDLSVILNVDADHLEYFGSLDGVKASFTKFANLAKTAVVANGDDQNTLDSLCGVTRPVILFGENESCDFVIHDIENYSSAFYSFALRGKRGEIGKFQLRVPGLHNVHNAAAAAVCAHLSGVCAADIQSGFDSFKGAGRRFEIRGVFGGITIADDYAHHPAEIKATLDAAAKMGFKRIFAVFQPFTYTRTLNLLDDFARVLSAADQVVMTEIMGSREVNTLGVYTSDLAAKIDRSVWFDSFDEISKYCLENAQAGDLIITMGCGDIYKAADMMVKQCGNSNR